MCKGPGAGVSLVCLGDQREEWCGCSGMIEVVDTEMGEFSRTK